MKRLFLIFLLVFSAASTSVGQQTIPPFSSGERVALVGDSITHGGHYHSYIWLYYMTRFPSMPVTLINCGVGGDEARSILDRWDWDVVRRSPTYITLTFGMNDTGYFGIYGKDVPESRSEAKVASSLENFSGLVGKLGDKVIEQVKGTCYFHVCFLFFLTVL